MRALLLAAGLGARLRPVTDSTPKCLVSIGGRPLLDYWLETLVGAGIERILVNTHHHAAQIDEFVHNSGYMHLVETIYEQELLGTGGTLLHNREFFRDGPVLLIHADNLCICDFPDFVHSHSQRPIGTDMTMMTFVANEPEACGVVEVDANGVVRAMHEKVKNPPGNLANAAVYIVEPSIFGFLASLGRQFIDFSLDALPQYMGRIHAWHNDGYHMDIGTLQNLQRAQEFMSAHARGWMRSITGGPDQG